MSSPRTRPIPHHELRQWGYDRCSQPDQPGTSVDGLLTQHVVENCLKALPFPSDYFPLRILRKIEDMIREVNSSQQPDKPLMILTARKMACLYQVLHNEGLELDEHFDIISDRFIFLEPNLEKTRKHLEPGDGRGDGPHIYLIDDIRRRGTQLERRRTNLHHHIDPLHDHRSDDIRCEAIIDLPKNPVDSEHFRLAGGQDGTGLIRAYSRTFARALMPYFTDFPISPKCELSAEEFAELAIWMKNREVHEVTSSIGIDERLRSYSIDIKEIWAGEEIDPQVKACLEFCDIIKLRIFVQTPRSADGKYQIRLMLKPMCRRMPAKRLVDAANTLNSGGLLAPNPTHLQLGQLFGYLEYLLSWRLLEDAIQFLPSNIRRQFTRKTVDEGFAGLILGKDLYQRATGGDLTAVFETLEKIYGASSRSTVRIPTSPAPGLHVIGDDLIEEVDAFICARTREERNSLANNSATQPASSSKKSEATASMDWRRPDFAAVLEGISNQAIRRFRRREESFDEFCEHYWTDSDRRRDHDKSTISNEFLIGLALDTLTDWGKLVPDQQAIDLGRRDVLSRLYAYSSEEDDKEQIQIERCFRAGEITAKIEKVTLTGGRLSISSRTFSTSLDTNSKRPKINPPWYGEQSSSASQEADTDSVPSSDPKKALHSLVEVLSALSDEIERITPREQGTRSRTGPSSPFEEFVGKARKDYLNLPCPIVTEYERPVDVEYAGELLNYYYSTSPTAASTGHAPYPGIKMAESQIKNWESSHQRFKRFPWSFGAFRRLKRAFLAVDTLLAVVAPLLHLKDSSRKNDPARLIHLEDLFQEDSLPGNLSNDVWHDWVSKLTAPPVPLRFSESDRLSTGESLEAVACTFHDLLGDAWHALVSASASLELEAESASPFESHKIRLYQIVKRLEEAIGRGLNDSISRADLDESEGDRFRQLTETGEVRLSPFGEQNVLYTAKRIVSKAWEFRSGGLWARLGQSELDQLVASGRVIEIVDWQGVKRYPSFQFAPFSLREGLRTRYQGGFLPPEADDPGVAFTDPDFPFLRRDISESMRGSSRAVNGWGAALWYCAMLRRVEADHSTSDRLLPESSGYRGLLFKESLSQKGLWIDSWLGDGRALLHNQEDARNFLNNHRRPVEDFFGDGDKPGQFAHG